MNEFDREQEQDFFVSQTAHLDIFLKSGEQAYSRFRLFQYDSLMLLRNQFESKFIEWLPVLERASLNQETEGRLKEVREEIVEYRKKNLGLKTFGPDRENATDALTVLFLLCLESWPERPEATADVSIAQCIDEFATTYIEFFGNSKCLLENLKHRFEM